jgi:hypothetical protein
MTLVIMALSIIIFSTMAFSLTKFRAMTLSIITFNI